MTRLPKRYFKSISDYVKTYYTAYGAQRAQKLYDAVKTVTKDFTRTDPVYVRIGEDGEPEIHCTMTKADGSSYFANMDLGNATLYVHNGGILTSIKEMMNNITVGKISIDLLSQPSESVFAFSNLKNCKSITFGEGTKMANLSGNPIFANYLGASEDNLEEIGWFDMSATTGLFYAFYGLYKLKEIPAFDFSNVTDCHETSFMCYGLTAFHATGMKCSFNLRYTKLTHDAILEVFNNLGEVDKTAGITLTLGSGKLALMSDEEKAIATGKGWVLA